MQNTMHGECVSASVHTKHENHSLIYAFHILLQAKSVCKRNTNACINKKLHDEDGIQCIQHV